LETDLTKGFSPSTAQDVVLSFGGFKKKKKKNLLLILSGPLGLIKSFITFF